MSQLVVYPHLGRAINPSSMGTEALALRILPALALCNSFFFFFFLLFRAVLAAYGRSQARGLIRAAAASLGHSQRNARSELCLEPVSELSATPDP